MLYYIPILVVCFILLIECIYGYKVIKKVSITLHENIKENKNLIKELDETKIVRNELINRLKFELKYTSKLKEYSELHTKYFKILMANSNVISKDDLKTICELNNEFKKLNKFMGKFNDLRDIDEDETEEESN